MDFFLNWCINCGKRSDYLYCCKECRLNDLKKKTTSLNENNYTLEFKNRKPLHSHSFYKTMDSSVNSSSVSPLIKINIPSNAKNDDTPNRNGSFSSSTSSNSSSNSDFSTLTNGSKKSNNTMTVSIYSSPPKETVKPQLPTQRPRYYIQTFHNQELKRQHQHQHQHVHVKPQQLLTPLSEKDNMDYENTSNNVFTTNPMYSEEEVNENSSHWYWSSDSDDEDDE